jgi:hypothetical protein
LPGLRRAAQQRLVGFDPVDLDAGLAREVGVQRFVGLVVAAEYDSGPCPGLAPGDSPADAPAGARQPGRTPSSGGRARAAKDAGHFRQSSKLGQRQWRFGLRIRRVERLRAPRGAVNIHASL